VEPLLTIASATSPASRYGNPVTISNALYSEAHSRNSVGRQMNRLAAKQQRLTGLILHPEWDDKQLPHDEALAHGQAR
jgi:hypothetical protein